MASASNSTTLRSNQGYTATLTASFNENSTSTSNNTSNITVTATQKIGNSDWSSSYNSSLQIYWYDDKNYGGGSLVATTYAKSQGRNATITASGTITVPHHSNGKLNGYAKAVWTKAGNSNWTPNSGSVSTGSTALTNIPRQANITSAPNFNDTDNPTIGYSNPAGSAVSSLQACIANPAGSVIYAAYRNINVNGSSYTFNLTNAERNTLRQACANSKTLAVKFYVTTVIGGNTYYSTLDRTMTIVNGEPTFTATYEDINSETTEVTEDNQQLIRNQSTLRINLSSITAQKSATISSIAATINGTTYTGIYSSGTTATITVGTLNISSNTTAAVTVTDSRGFSTTQNLTLQMIDWSAPSAIVTTVRQNHFYTPTTLTVDADYSSLGGKNALSIRYRYEPLSELPATNIFDYSDDYDANPAAGVSVTLNSDGSLTAYGAYESSTPPICIIVDQDITSDLVDGDIYTLSQTEANEDFCVSITAASSDYSEVETYSCANQDSVSFVVDKSTYAKYTIMVGLGLDSYSRYEQFSLTEAFSLIGSSSASWSTWQTIQDNVPTVVNLDNQSAWAIQVVVADKLASTVYNTTVARGMPIIFFDNRLSSVGINCFPTGEQTLELNGVNIMRSVMTRSRLSNISNLTTNTYVKIPLGGSISSGNQLTATTDGGIKIGKNVSKILVSGRMLISTNVVGEYYIRICKNSTDNTIGWVTHSNKSTSATFESIDITPTLADVEENDVIYMYYYVPTSSATIYGTTYGSQTSLTVETVG